MSVEAYTTLYLALSWVFINNCYNQGPRSKYIIEKLQNCLPDDLNKHTGGLKKIVEENGNLEALEKFGNTSENQRKFYIN